MTSAVTISVNDSIATYGLSGSFSFNGMDFKFKNFEIKVVILTTGRVSTSKDVILGLLSAIDTCSRRGVEASVFIVGLGVAPPRSSVFVTREESLARKSGIRLVFQGVQNSSVCYAVNKISHRFF